MTKATAVLRSHSVAQTLEAEIGSSVKLAGWVQRRRDLGSIVFIDLRDRSGIVQLVFDAGKGTPEKVMDAVNQVRNEYVITVTGTVVKRAESAVNTKIATGQIEISVNSLEVLNTSKNPPFYIQDGIDVEEPLRLKYRYLDLRRPEMQQMLMLRHKVFRSFRNFLDAHGFVDVETPILTKSTPEGARDYLVPSRLQAGEFYALPQSPQLFKQLLMVSGLERYYQIARCFRDEDLRADRQPEFTQLDIEQSFLSIPEFHELVEEMTVTVFREVLDVEIPRPFQRLPYSEAMNRYGSDKPDLRFEMPIENLSDVVQRSGFRVFQDALAAGGTVRAITAPGCASWSRKQTDQLVEFVKSYGLQGLAFVAVQEDGLKSSIAKFLTEDELQGIVTTAGAGNGDLVIIAAAPSKAVLQALGALRSKLGSELGLIDESLFRFLWVTDFPLLSYDEEEGRYVAEHHPFTMPNPEDLELLDSDPGKVRALAYDLVLNGYEVAGGSMRIYRREIQERMFEALGFSKEQAYQQFGFLLDAFEFGTPPHGGIAFGLDRFVMIMGNGKSLRDCIAFPKTSSGTDLMTDAPSEVSPEQLSTLRLTIQKKVPAIPRA